jgi:hypothetical protein
MPMIDVYADSTLFPEESHKALGLDLTNALPCLSELFRNTRAPESNAEERLLCPGAFGSARSDQS